MTSRERDGLARPDRLFTRAAEAYRERWKPALAIVLLGNAAFLAAFLTAGAVSLGSFFFAPSLGATVVIFAVATACVFSLGVLAWSQAALFLAAVPSSASPGLASCLDASWRRLPGFALVCCLYLAACVGGTCLLVVPGLAASLYLVFGPLIYLTEDVGPVEALLKSWHYVKGRSWPVLGRLCAIGAVGSLPGFVPLAGFLLQLLAWPFVLMCLAALLEELRRLRGSEPFVPARREKAALAVVAGCSAIPLLLLPWALPRIMTYMVAHADQLLALLMRSR